MSGRQSKGKLALVRIKAGFPYAREAALKLGVSRIYLLAIEEGHDNPSPTLRLKMAKLYAEALPKPHTRKDVAVQEINRIVKRIRLDMIQRKLRAAQTS